MKFTQIVAAAAASSVVLAAPVQKRAITDIEILNYALTLEHLEATFYKEALANYTVEQFYDAGYGAYQYSNLQQVADEEAEHVTFLTAAITAAGGTPVAACTYAFGVTTPTEFFGLASVLEGVGVSAYLGAAASISNPAYLTYAASVLTVESRHKAYVASRLLTAPYPQPFDTPLDFDEVYTLAAEFITSCPSTNPALPVTAFPTLTATTVPSPLVTNSTVVVTTTASLTGDVYAAFAAVTGPVFTPATVSGSTVTFDIPAGVYGQSYVVLTSNSTAVSDTSIIAGPAILLISSTFDGTNYATIA